MYLIGVQLILLLVDIAHFVDHNQNVCSITGHRPQNTALFWICQDSWDQRFVVGANAAVTFQLAILSRCYGQ
ncbi:MAG: hypothetical protein EBU88_02285 [Acidobacteria bacterium]|nr:hypothetical protein [Acidobacteriota bacterium]